MDFDQFKVLIDQLAACNGTARAELENKIKLGEVKPEDVDLILYYANLQRLGKRLDDMARKVPAVS